MGGNILDLKPSETQDVKIQFSSDVKRQLAELYRATTDYELKGGKDHEFDVSAMRF